MESELFTASVCSQPLLTSNRRDLARTTWIWTGAGACRGCKNENIDGTGRPLPQDPVFTPFPSEDIKSPFMAPIDVNPTLPPKNWVLNSLPTMSTSTTDNSTRPPNFFGYDTDYAT
jgi:hypothetical protein